MIAEELPELREIATLEEAVALLDEWIAAYEELRREYMREQHRHHNTKLALEHANSACEHFEFVVNGFAPVKKRVSPFDR